LSTHSKKKYKYNRHFWTPSGRIFSVKEDLYFYDTTDKTKILSTDVFFWPAGITPCQIKYVSPSHKNLKKKRTRIIAEKSKNTTRIP
jgi:hypothetical protein